MTNPQGAPIKDELQTKLVEILSSIQSATGKASDFAMEQLPEIAQSYVLYGRVSLTFYLVFGLSILGGLTLLAHRIEREGKKADKDFPSGLPYFTLGGTGALLGGGMFLANLSSAMLVWFAPKVWLLKEIASLVK